MLSRVLALLCLCAVSVVDWTISATPVSAAGAGTIKLAVTSAYASPIKAPFRDAAVTAGQQITEFKWQINEDSIGDPTFDPAKCLPSSARDANTPTAGTWYDTHGGAYPDACTWASIRAIDGQSKIVANGDQSSLNSNTSVNLPNGKYLISVTAGGFKIDGTHFTVNGDTTTVGVKMNALPLPSVTVRVNVFNDNVSTNGQYDGVPEDTNMAGFTAHLNELIGEVNFDVYGNALCTQYELDATTGEMLFDADGAPIPAVVPSNQGATGGQLAGSVSQCISDASGDIVIPNLGPNRYAVTVVPPDPQSSSDKKWIQTTTLEGGHDWDTWNMEGSTGFDTELVVGGEATPFVHFGFVQEQSPRRPYAAGISGTVKGRVMIGRTYVSQTGGLPNPGAIWGGGTGTVLEAPVEDAWISLACLATCPGLPDQAQFVQKANSDGTFSIGRVPAGTWNVTIWDEAQVRLLDTVQITVKATKTTDIGDFPLAGWFTELSGSVFLDRNANGKRDAGEAGVPGFPLTLRTRVNTLNDQGAASASTNDAGEWAMEAYPLGQFLILEAYHQGYKTTGATWKLGNDPQPFTQLTDQVDWNVLNIFGLAGQIDIGVQAYAPGSNGGIVGTVSYDTTRNELNPRNAAAEDWQPGVPGVTMQLWAPKRVNGSYVTVASGSNEGAIKQYGAGGCTRNEDDYGKVDAAGGCDPLPDNTGAATTQTTESWSRPTGCTSRTADGKPAYSQVLPQSTNSPSFEATPDMPCIEAPMMSVQFGTNGEVDGNYGFGDLNIGDYLVEAVPPADTTVLGNPANPKPLYKFTDEASINIFDGDTYIPQNGLYTASGAASEPAPVAVTDYRENTSDSACAGRMHTIDSSGNPNFVAGGGSPMEGLTRPYCDVKLVQVKPRRSIAPIFHVYTDVAIPTRFVGYIIDDLNVSTNPKSTVYGEKAGMQNVPVGVYDFTGRLVYTAESDYNGYYEALLPSTDTIACPTPSGVCPNVYRLVGNDPGQLGHPNLNFNPQYRTIGTEFQGWPGVVHPVDQAPSRVAASFQLPGSQGTYPPACAVPAAQPEFFTINKPYGQSTDATFIYTIKGKNFGNARGTGQVLLNSTAVTSYSAWNDTTISFTIPAGLPAGQYNVSVVNGGGQKATNGVTLHLLGSGYNPTIIEVSRQNLVEDTAAESNTHFTPNSDPLDGSGPRAIQRALDRARRNGNNAQVVVVVYPNMSSRPEYTNFNPDHAYFENVIMHSNVKLQGVGPGGPGTPGSRIDGRYIWGATAGANGTEITPYFDSWEAAVSAFPLPNNVPLTDPVGQVVYVRPETTNQFNNSYNAALDGFTITGGDQQGFPTNLNFLGGGPNGTPRTGPAGVEAQGGGVMINNYGRNTQISNNVFIANGGSFGGAIRVGTPELGTTPNSSTNNTVGVKIAHNRIVANGGTMFAGAIGIFYGSDNYDVSFNDICGNASAEYGAGISHYGRSGGGRIHHNRIYLNQSYDEAGGVMIAGELPANTARLSDGAGSVTIDHNEIIANLSNDDGGGIRFLMAAGGANYAMGVNDNIIANNVATHEGGGIAIDDTPNVRIVNNTIVKNITTATAMTSDGFPAPAGIATGGNSALLQGRLNTMYGASSSPKFSNPVILNNILADNRAGQWTNAGVAGIGLTGDLTAILRWDVGTTDGSGKPLVVASLIDSAATNPLYHGGTGYTLGTDTVNIENGATSGIDTSNDKVKFVKAFDTAVSVANWRTFPAFRPAAIVTFDQPVKLMADYRLALTARPIPDRAVDHGLPSRTAAQLSQPNNYGIVSAPLTDIDNQDRPAGSAFDMGADELPAPPVASLLDDFNRSNSTSLGGSWLVRPSGPNSPLILSGSAASGHSTGFDLWNAEGISFPANQRAGFTITQLPTSTATKSIGLILKANGNATSNPTSYIEVRYTELTHQIQIGYSTTGSTTPTFVQTISRDLNAGNRLLAKATNTGLVTVLVDDIVVTSATLPAVWGAANNNAGGQIGVRYIGALNDDTTTSNTTKIDNFVGGSL